MAGRERKPEMVSIDSIEPAAYNPNSMTSEEFDLLRASIRANGWLEPITVNRRNRTIVGGHQRVEAARAEGIEEVPVFWVDLTEEQERVANVALNRIRGEPDEDLVAENLLGSFSIDPIDEVPDATQPRGEHRTIRVVLSEEQGEIVRRAIEAAESAGSNGSPESANRVGNLVSRICFEYLKDG